MTQQKQPPDSSGKRPGETVKPGEQEAGEGSKVSCRCKEVSKKTLPEMLRLMLSDLAFWKKAKGHEED